MNIKFLKSGFLLLMVSALFAVGVIYATSNQNSRQYIGNLVFAKSSSQIANIGEIILKPPSDTITLSVEDNLWRVKEANNYYANYTFIKELFDEISNSSFYRKQNPLSEAKLTKYDLDAKGFQINVFDKNGQLLNSVLIGKKTANGLYHFAKIKDNSDVFLITGKYSLPQKTFSWLEQPLLAIADNSVLAITLDNQGFERSDITTPFHISGTNTDANIKGLLRQFEYLPAISAISAHNFNALGYQEQKNITITTFDGLIITIKLYGNGQEYWINISLSSTTLPTTKISDYIKDNAFLYDNWYFEISPQVGKLLFNYIPL